MGIQRGLCPSSRGSWDRGWRKNARCPAESLVWLPLKACLVPLLTCILHKYLPSPLTFLEKLSTVKGYMGSNSKLIVSDCTCNDNVTVPNLIQSKERIAESTGLFVVFFSCHKVWHSVCRAASTQAANRDWVECRVTPWGWFIESTVFIPRTSSSSILLR